MSTSHDRWQTLYNQVPLSAVPHQFAGLSNSPFLMQYMTAVLQLCPHGGRSLETGIGTGFSAIWLSLRGVQAEGYDNVPALVERARLVNNALGGAARFRTGDLFTFFDEWDGIKEALYDVIHHQGVLEHFTVPDIWAILAQQVARAQYVVFSVPSVYYTDPEIGDERLLPLEEWQRILEPFDVVELKYYGHPQSGNRDHILCTLRGRRVDEALLAMMRVGDDAYRPGISAIVHTRNEERHIAACLETLQGWTDEIIVCDMESDDATLEIASRYTDNIVHHPLISNFDGARNVSAMRAACKWVFYLDADERVPAGLGDTLRQCVENKGNDFEAMLIPFRHHFAGHWMKSMYPGYTSARLFKNGRFVFNARLHAGAQVDGRSIHLSADDSSQALVHYSFDSFSHYLTKLNRYTDGEAINMQRDGRPFHWQNAIRHFVGDFKAYYDMGAAAQDGVHGFIYSFHSAFYRFEQHAKLFELRHNNRQLQPEEEAVPASVEQVLEYALQVLRERPPRQTRLLSIQAPVQDTNPTVQPSVEPQEIAVEANGAAKSGTTDVVWCGPLFDPSGYGEEVRNFVRASDAAGLAVAAHELPWSDDEVVLSPEEYSWLRGLTERTVAPGFTQIIQNFPTAYVRHPAAGLVIGRTMFETDRLPRNWVVGCNRLDYIWVPSEFNRRTFEQAGVSPEKLAVIPGCLDTRIWQDEEVLNRNREPDSPFTFLTVFDWTLHKGWDVLLRAFLREFKADEKVALVFKVWSTMGYNPDSIREQAARLMREEFDLDLAADERIRFVFERLDSAGLRELYRECDAFVLPSRGEGWGRPYMEAMAAGLPTIGTHWSGNTAFMTPDNSYLVDCSVVDVPEKGWREIQTYRGHRWAEPDLASLCAQMRRVTTERDEAKARGLTARNDMLTRFNPEAVGALIAAELERVRQLKSADKAAFSTKSIAVRWEGQQFEWHSLAHVNREFCLGLADDERIDLSIVTDSPQNFAMGDDPRFEKLAERRLAPLSHTADVHVRHFFPPRLQAPDEGHFVLIQPWEYGYLPKEWLQPIRDNVSEVWCYSQYVKDVYIASGIDEAKLHVVPLGVDSEVFKPDAPPFVFSAEPGAQRHIEAKLKRGKSPFIFLYAGGTIHRKGFDILLDAYLKAFSAYDDVCLLVKDTGTETVYRGVNEGERICALSADPSRPAIVYVGEDLSMHQMAGIYTAADCLVAPYRGEGFLLPALEAMACGLPVLVTDGGPTDDFVDEEVGWRIPATKKLLGTSTVGEYEFCGPAWQFEIDSEELAAVMRIAYADRDEAKRRGAAGAAKVAKKWTWRHATEAAQARLEALSALPVPQRLKAPVNAKKKRMATETAASVNGTPRKQPTISLCMIARDEERVLGHCLKSIKPWVDEIIVVDTGSVDRTPEIAEEHGARVIHFPWGRLLLDGAQRFARCRDR